MKAVSIWTYLFVFGLLGAAFVAYGPALHGDFIWDDYPHVAENPHMTTWKGLKTIWTSVEAVNYPLTSTTFWIGRHVWGLNPFPYHVLNIFLHTLNAILFWVVLKQIGVPGSRFAAAIFALHPVHAESVAWITELKNVQSYFFYLAAVLTFLKFRASSGKEKMIWYGAALFSFLLSLLSKTASLMLPAVMPVLCWWQDRRWNRNVLIPLFPFFVLSGIAATWTIWEQAVHIGMVEPVWSLSWFERFAISGKAIWFYLGKLVWPDPLIFVYERWTLEPGRSGFYLGTIGFFIVLLFVLLARKRRWVRPVFVAGACFAVSLFPVLGFFNMNFMRHTFVTDHYLYLASVFPIALFAAMLWNGRRMYALRLAVSLLILASLTTLTWRRACVYVNELTLWQDTVKKNPRSWIAHNNLGSVYLSHGMRSEAITHYREAIRLEPEFAYAHTNLGVALGQQGQLNEAIDHFLTALRLDPKSSEAHNGLGSILARMGKIEEAVRHYERAIQLKPDYAAPRQNLDLLSLRRGEFKTYGKWIPD